MIASRGGTGRTASTKGVGLHGGVHHDLRNACGTTSAQCPIARASPHGSSGGALLGAELGKGALLPARLARFGGRRPSNQAAKAARRIWNSVTGALLRPPDASGGRERTSWRAASSAATGVAKRWPSSRSERRGGDEGVEALIGGAGDEARLGLADLDDISLASRWAGNDLGLERHDDLRRGLQ